MQKRALAIAAGLLLAGCGPSAEELMTGITVAEIRHDLLDPQSLQFSETMIQVDDNRGAVCGYMNAANVYGGMVGRERFVRVFDPDDMKALRRMAGKGQQDRDMIWRVHTNYRRMQRGELAVPRPPNLKKTPGLFLESEEPVTTMEMTTAHCLADARPVELQP